VTRLRSAQIFEQRLLPPIAFSHLQQSCVEHLTQRAALGQCDRVILTVERDLQHAQRAGKVAQDNPGQQRFVVYKSVNGTGLQRFQSFLRCDETAIGNPLVIEIVGRRRTRRSADAD